MDERSRENYNEESDENIVDKREMNHYTLGFKVRYMNKNGGASVYTTHVDTTFQNSLYKW